MAEQYALSKHEVIQILQAVSFTEGYVMAINGDHDAVFVELETISDLLIKKLGEPCQNAK